MEQLYNLAIGVYGLSVRLASLFSPKAMKWVEGRENQFGYIQKKIPKNANPVWFHCASLGEFEQGRPVMEAYRKLYPHKKILLTFFSPSGFEIRKNYTGADYIFYLPLDTPANARNFVEAVHPQMAIFVKYEFWYNYISELHEKKIPLIVISAIFRENQPFFRWYGGFWRKMLKKVAGFYVQDENSLKLLKSIGVHNVAVAGDTRFDRVAETAQSAKKMVGMDFFCEGSKVLVAGSTWPEDEKLLLRIVQSAPESYKFIIAPHEIGPEHIGQLMEMFSGEKAVLWSAFREKPVAGARILLVDTIGILSKLYRYGTLAYIGGGFGKGIHNILEAATFGLPVIFGPNYEKFKEAKELLALGGAFSVLNGAEALDCFQELARKPKKLEEAGALAKAYINANTGATKIIIDRIGLK